MATMTVQFANIVNITAQPGDIVYFTDDPEGEVIYPIGPIASITTQGNASVNNTLNITARSSTSPPASILTVIDSFNSPLINLHA